MEETEVRCLVCKEFLTEDDLHIQLGKDPNECVCDACLRDHQELNRLS